MGRFHCDPHPGNLLVTDDGVLCLIDYGLCAEVEVSEREAMTKAIVHLLYRDFDALIHIFNYISVPNSDHFIIFFLVFF